MKSTQYILAELNSFVTHFTKTRVRYEHDSLAKVHVIEVVPNHVYHLDQEYIQWESNFFNRFILEFPHENICFISDDAIVGIQVQNTVLYGNEFTPVTTNKEAIEVINKKITNKHYPSAHLNQKFTSTEMVSSTDTLSILAADYDIKQTVYIKNKNYPLAA